jgi:glucose/arabinose dehydrogenase
MKTPLPPKLNTKKNCFFILILLSAYSLNTLGQPTISFNQIAGSLTQPLEIKNAGDGSGRLFVAEQGGKIKIYKNGNIRSTPFLDISSLVGADQFQGIWSIAFSPGYKNNGNFFMLYTDKNGTTALARYKVSSTNPNLADPKSSIILLSYPKSGAGHYGNIAFGSNGYLYISLGAGGNNKNSQDGQSDFGKMLRINVNVNTPPYYSNPPNNPFVGDNTILNEVWATGLRNAWRWSFDRSNDDMWIADVGQDSMEEVDYRTKFQGLHGSNFGWQCFEGTKPYKPNDCTGKNNLVFPIFEYHHDIPAGGECLIGGYVYRGSSYPGLKGYYICADFVTANLWKIKAGNSGNWNVYIQQKGVPTGITSFGEDENGELYAVSNKYGVLYVLSTAGSYTNESASPSVFASNKSNLKTTVYPTLVENNTITLDLKESYQSVRIIDMTGRQVMNQVLEGNLVKTTLYLTRLSTGIYIVQCIGKQTFQQKIYFKE